MMAMFAEPIQVAMGAADTAAMNESKARTKFVGTQAESELINRVCSLQGTIEKRGGMANPTCVFFVKRLYKTFKMLDDPTEAANVLVQINIHEPSFGKLPPPSPPPLPPQPLPPPAAAVAAATRAPAPLAADETETIEHDGAASDADLEERADLSTNIIFKQR